MTCIVGLVHDDVVYIGADSAGVDGQALVIRADRKVFRKDPFVIGFTTSFRMGQLLQYKLRVPAHDPKMSIEEYMVTVFVDAVRQCLKDGGFAKKNDEVESGGAFLVGYCGRLFMIDNDYQVGEGLDEFAAVGCGAPYALGALYATRGQSPEMSIEMALRAAERFSTGVRAPFHIESLGND